MQSLGRAYDWAHVQPGDFVEHSFLGKLQVLSPADPRTIQAMKDWDWSHIIDSDKWVYVHNNDPTKMLVWGVQPQDLKTY